MFQLGLRDMVIECPSLDHARDHFTTGPLDHFTTGPLYHWTTLPLDHFTTGPLYHFTTGPLYHWTTFNFTTLPLYHWTTLPLDHWTTEFLTLNSNISVLPGLNYLHLVPIVSLVGHLLRPLVLFKDVKRDQSC